MKQPVSISKKTRIAVLDGGWSNEREISLRSGRNCLAALKRLGYENAQEIDVDKNIGAVLTQKNIEVAFLALHGKPGEDGTIQGLLELMQIPYTGSGVLASALAMSKPLTKQVLQAHKIPSAETVIIDQHEAKNFKEIAGSINWMPVMVKPLAEGSSVGVSKVDDLSALVATVEETITKFGGAIVEKYIKGQEITVGVLEESGPNKNGKGIWALPILELRPKSKAGFYDFEAKYTKGMTDFILPAEISASATEAAHAVAIRTFKAMQCSGYARVDMIVDASEQPHVLEVNTLPGMTDTSDLPAMAEVAGISYDQLVERILFSSGVDK
ncbi:MAG TPA: D-alanine--D-alanine ligase [Candidatus Obscuribacterales bacterium]